MAKTPRKPITGSRSFGPYIDSKGTSCTVEDSYNVTLQAYSLTCTCAVYKKQFTGVLQHCEHIEKCIVLKQDTVGIWAGKGGVMVPMHRNPALAPIVTLEKEDLGGLIAVKLEYTTNSNFFETEHLGYIQYQQSRLDLRELLSDWLVERSVGLPVCKAPHHFSPYPWSIDGFDVINAEHMVCLFDLITTEWCRACNLSTGVPDLADLA